MRVSITVNDYSWPDLTVQLGRIAAAADRFGVDTLWVPDHLLQADPQLTLDGEMPEAYTTLGFLAARTERVRLGTMVTGATFRPPAVTVKAVTTLDVLSGGRAWFGIGAGHHEGEARAMGLPFPPTGERFERMEETVRIALHMWSGEGGGFEGKHYHLENPVSSPQPVRRPPILIGGAGERRTLRLVAQYADACNVFDIPDGGRTVKHKLAVLARHCAEIGRPYEEIDKTISTRLNPAESATEFAARCARFTELGIDHAVVLSPHPWTEADVALVAEAAALSG
ncbi:LLM class F420-dependent oxidoreductase [Amycolatopsis taiwanensis]|uniref:LLM class F420-dependent oxidoreductase n=1 Tax=Amycolatopsis taiwanensis TaxID=342230 RepID=A0A9W6R6R3_9PSEU|nr:LLM class F420-dependent oxidoreductase [Amycolatopsis taiwanensis]GLY70081.1 LLM class F420-dependent oxidoreductase [Amycolatopsis taiwanensis]